MTDLRSPKIPKVVIKLFKEGYKSGIAVAQYKSVMEKEIRKSSVNRSKEEKKMKNLMSGLAIMVAVVGFSVFGMNSEAKADYKTLHGIADIIEATGHFTNGGHYSRTVYYEPAPVYYEPVYSYPRYRRSHYYRHHRPRYSRHCY